MGSSARAEREADRFPRATIWLAGSLVLVGATPALLLALGLPLPWVMGITFGVGAAAASGIGWHLSGRLRDYAELQGALKTVQPGVIPELFTGANAARPGSAAWGFNQLCRTIETTRKRSDRLADLLRTAPEAVGRLLEEISSGGEAQEEAVEETASLLSNINTSIRQIKQEVERLSTTSNEVSSSILEMGCSIDEVANSAAHLTESVDASTASVQQMGASIRQVSENADSVQSMAEESAASIFEMDRAIQEVGEHVTEASALTQQLHEEAQGGSVEVRATIDGIHEIRSLTSDARSVLEKLAGRIAEIGEIVTVIGSINEETHLLSLNAAIIAAQAGEQGKAFAVVASHVKTLSQRTAGSTKQIAELIHAVQEESSNAIEAMDAGIQAVETGVDRSQRAGNALEQIRESASQASARVAEISRAANEQGRNSRHVAEAAQMTSERIQHINQALSEQSAASDSLMSHAEASLETCRQVHRATEEQRHSSRLISESVRSILDMIQAMERSTGAHSAASESLSNAAARILEVARRSAERVPEALRVLETLSGEARMEAGPDTLG